MTGSIGAFKTSTFLRTGFSYLRMASPLSIRFLGDTLCGPASTNFARLATSGTNEPVPAFVKCGCRAAQLSHRPLPLPTEPLADRERGRLPYTDRADSSRRSQSTSFGSTAGPTLPPAQPNEMFPLGKLQAGSGSALLESLLRRFDSYRPCPDTQRPLYQ